MSDKILALADLHICEQNSEELRLVKKLVDGVKPVQILIAGDVFENDIDFDPYIELSKLGAPVIACFGNHEFAYRDVPSTKKFYTDLYKPSLLDVHYLDIIGSKSFMFNGEEVNVIGNVLWYDGSLKDIPSQSDTVISDRWLDASIHHFDFRAENAANVEQIKRGFKKGCKNVLLTHTCPDRKLNLFSLEKPSIFNMYSGMNHLLSDLKRDGIAFDFSICGHTHRRTNCEIDGTPCVNIGNDYLMRGLKIENFVIEEL